MTRSSIGFHTFTMFKGLTAADSSKLLSDFNRYRKETGKIKIYFDYSIYKNGKTLYIRNKIAQQELINEVNHEIENAKFPLLVNIPSVIYTIKYNSNDTGINKWTIRSCIGHPSSNGKSYLSFIVEATINPLVLSGNIDYLSAANQEDVKVAFINFDKEAKNISKVLGRYMDYKLNRVDYCINFDLAELDIGCTTEQMMDLIKKGNIPCHYKERYYYDNISHRYKTDKNNFYLKSKSVVINCYNKYAHLLKEYPGSPNIEESRNLIRFEVQCKYNKIYNILKSPRKVTRCSWNDIHYLLSDDLAKDIINNYFNKIIFEGDYYTLSKAIDIIKQYKFIKSKEDRLIETLIFINESRGVWKAKNKLTQEEILKFNLSLQLLNELKINPVTVPREYKLSHIPNLYKTFHLKKLLSNLR